MAINDIWYDRGPLLSHSEAMIYGALGGRGTGKTFNFKLWSTFDTKENNEFVWMRRYDNDLDKVMNSWMTDLIKASKVPDGFSWKIDNDRLFINDKLKVHFVALSKALKLKSVSYANVNTIIFDEFIEEAKNKDGSARGYLNNEVETFLGFIETVNRLRLDRPEVRVIMLANKASWVNPYFAYWNIRPFSERFKSFHDGLIVIENYQNKDFSDAKKKTKFGRLIAGTRFGDYVMDNEVWQDSDAFLRIRPKNTELRAGIHFNGQYIGLFTGDGNIYCCKHKGGSVKWYAPRGSTEENERPLISGEPPISWLLDYSTANKLYFENNVIKSTIHEVMLHYYK